MSHIPASKMPHAHAHDDEPATAPGAEPINAKATSTTVTGDTNAMNGSAGTVDRPAAANAPQDTSAENASVDRSPLAVAALVLGGLAVVGGIVAAVLPLLAQPEKPKSRKRRKRKAA